MTDESPSPDSSESPQKRPTVSADDFVTAWCNSQTLDDVVEATGLTPGACRARASAYRRRNINLKKLRAVPKGAGAGRPRLDVDALNALIAENTSDTEAPASGNAPAA